MEIRFQRETNHSYLVISLQEKKEKNYQISMLLQNEIERMLPVHLQMIDGVKELYFEITSKETLKQRYEARILSKTDILNLLISVSRMWEDMERYLLKCSGLILDAEYLFVGEDCSDIRFCYNPESGGSTAEGLNRLACFIMDHIDYEDRECVRVAYALFQESLKENTSIQDFIRTVVEKQDNEKKMEQSEDSTKDSVNPGADEIWVSDENRFPDKLKNNSGKKRRRTQIMSADDIRKVFYLLIEIICIGCVNAFLMTGILWIAWKSGENAARDVQFAAVVIGSIGAGGLEVWFGRGLLSHARLH